MSEIDISQHYPGVNTEQRRPALFRINGFGVGLYGRRDTEPQTGMYVKTQCLSALFIPVFALRSYVVAPADGGGWYVLGRVPVSGLAKLLNLVVLLAVITAGASIGLGVYASMPGPKAQREMAAADDLRDAGRTDAALRGYSKLAYGDSDLASQADAAFIDLVTKTVAEDGTQEASNALGAAVTYSRARRFSSPAFDPFALAMDRATSDTQSPADGRLQVLDAVESVVNESRRDAWFTARLGLLEEMVASGRADVGTVIELALVYEARNDSPRVRELLEPRRGELAATEGARALGQALAEAGDADGAFELLDPYVRARLTALHEAEDDLDDAYERVYREAIDFLETGKESQAWYDRYDRLGEAEQDAMVDAFIDQRLDSDADYPRALARYFELTDVVPAALDLGIARLDRARAMTDPDARRRELEAAEKTFLAVQGTAGDSASYQLYLGQVYYWLGKPDEGQALFDQLLADHAENVGLILEIARTLRQVGEVEKCRALYEQAYDAEPDGPRRYYIARGLSAIGGEVDEQIKWLERSDPDDTSTQAALACARGQREVQSGNDEAAADYFDTSIRLYDTMEESSSVLNNSALVWQERYALTGETADLSEAVDRLARAVELEPGDRVLLGNAADMMLGLVYQRALGDRLDLRALQAEADAGLFGYLYNDEAGQRELWAQVQADPMFARAKSMLQRVALLAPKSVGSYYTLMELYARAEDTDALRRLVEQTRAAQPDTDGPRKYYDEALTDDNDAEQLARSRRRMAELESTLAGDGLSDATRAAALTMLAGEMYAAHSLGEQVDLDRAVALAEEANTLHPGPAARQTLRYVLMLRAERDHKQAHPILDALAERLGETVTGYERFILAMEADAGLRAAAAEHPDVKRVVELVHESYRLFPSSGSAQEWALMRQLAPEHANTFAQRLLDDGAGQASRELYYLLGPYLSRSVFAYARAHEIAGDSQRAQQVLDDYAALGYPLP